LDKINNLAGYTGQMPKLPYDILYAAMEGLQAQRDKLDDQIARLRRLLIYKPGVKRDGGKRVFPAAASPEPRPKRVLSAAARQRIAAAQKKRWAAVRKETASAMAKKSARKVVKVAGVKVAGKVVKAAGEGG
jgi:hypothetical protein